MSHRKKKSTKTPNTGRNLKRKRTAKKKRRRLRPAKSADQTGDWGRPNVGKSTLTNRVLLGEERVVVYDMPARRVMCIHSMERDGREYVLIDTAGVRKRGKITDAVEKILGNQNVAGH
ncbi:hypothetical protein DMI62_08865 [Escherichia coli]|nr:hypothetical protein [Escherichia coli]